MIVAQQSAVNIEPSFKRWMNFIAGHFSVLPLLNLAVYGKADRTDTVSTIADIQFKTTTFINEVWE